MKYCNKCNNALPDDAMFCNNCGHPVGTQITQRTGMVYPQTVVNTASKKNYVAWIVGSISVVLSVGFIVFIVVFVLFMGNDSVVKRDTTHIAKEEQTEEKLNDTLVGGLEELSFDEPSYTIETGNLIDMQSHLTGDDNLNMDEIDWQLAKEPQVNNDDVFLGTDGSIRIDTPDTNVTLNAVDSENQSVLASCDLSTMSEEDVLRYQIQSLNEEIPIDSEFTSVLGPTTEEKTTFTEGDFTGSHELNVKAKDTVWDSTLFYSLEDINKDSDEDGEINTYILEKKLFHSEQNGSDMELELYRNPISNSINKLVSIENVSDGEQPLKVNEFYYKDNGDLNFAYSYGSTNYVPSYATPDKDGIRVLFDNDCLATWREVTGRKEVN